MHCLCFLFVFILFLIACLSLPEQLLCDGDYVGTVCCCVDHLLLSLMCFVFQICSEGEFSSNACKIFLYLN